VKRTKERLKEVVGGETRKMVIVVSAESGWNTIKLADLGFFPYF
jgi:hypothetical protein